MAKNNLILNKRNSIIGALAIVIASSLWGLDAGLLRPKLYHLDFFVVVFLEHLIAFSLMLPFFIYEIKEIKKLDKKDWIVFGLIALFGGAIGTLAITKAFFSVFLDNISSVSVVVLLQKLQPIFAITMAMLFLKEKPDKKFYPLAALALLGSYLVAFGFSIPSFAAENNAWFVPALSILAAFSFAAGTVLGKSAVKKVSFRMATYLRFGLTTIIMVFLIIIFNRFEGFSAIAGPNLLVLLIIALTTGGAAIFIYYYGLKRVMACKATIYELGFPITAMILDYFIHGHLLTFGQWIGAIAIIGSISMIANIGKKRC